MFIIHVLIFGLDNEMQPLCLKERDLLDFIRIINNYVP